MVDFPHKILFPQRPAHLISRPHLNELLSAIVDRRLITLSAPAGYGKTSLLIDFTHSVSTLPVCWYTLDSIDQDPWVFLSYLTASIDQRFPGSTKQTAALLDGRSANSFRAASAMLVREVYALGRDFVIVIDDWHLVDHIADISDLVMNLLFRCLHCHFILTSRSYPSLPNITLLAGRRQMNSLDALQLHFTAEEVVQMIDAEYGTVIELEQASALVERFKGWVTGILLSYQATSVPEAGPALSSISAERQVYHFLVEQVFDKQPPEIGDFLLDSSLIDDLTPDRCDAILQRHDSRQKLEIILRHHLFITEIKPGVLRYHPLFREFLQEHYRTLHPERYQAALRRVADMYAAQEQWSLAFDRYIAAGDRAAARQVIAKGGELLYLRGRLETLERWFAELPSEDLDASLLCLKASVALDRGNEQEAQLLVDLAERQAQPGEKPVVMLLQAKLLRIAGRYEQALERAQQVLELVESPAMRSAALRNIAICHHRLDQTALAIDELNQAIVIERQRSELHIVAQLERDLGVCHRDIGLLAMAEDYFTRADAYWTAIENMGMRAMCLNSKGSVQRLAGRYVEAHATLCTALEFAREALVPDYQAAVLSSLGDVYSDLQLWERASAAYGDARKVSVSSHLVSSVALAELWLLVRRGWYDEAARSLRQLPEAAQRYYGNEVLLLRGSIACGKGQHEEAAALAEQVIAAPQRSGSLMECARAYLLQAQIIAAAPHTQRAALLQALDQSVEMAQQLNHDTFLVAATFHTRAMLRHASAAGWVRATDWLQRQKDMSIAAQMIDQDDGRPVLVVRALGVDQIILDGQAVELGWSKAREVLYYLFAHPDGASIDTLCEAIWPDVSAERARNTLGTAIYQLRSALLRDLIVLHGRQVYRINRDVVRCDYDIEQFLHAADAGSRDYETILEALDLYHGAYLSCIDSLWIAELQAHLEQRYLRLLHAAATHCEATGMYADALSFYERVLHVDTLDEAAHVGIMRSHIGLNNRASAMSQYHTLRRILDEELGLDMGENSEAAQLYDQILNAS